MAEKKKVRIDDKNFAKSAGDHSELMGRDTIYVDTDDDITSVIEKVTVAESGDSSMFCVTSASVMLTVHS